MIWFEFVVLSFICVLGVPVLTLLAQVLLARNLREPAPERPGDRIAEVVADRPSVAVLIPAHDEEGALGRTLACVGPQLLARDRLLVVADNCTDLTAAIARSWGAEVLVRHHDTLRGKGFALDHGVRALAGDPREIVVIVDADCCVEPGAIDRLARQSGISGRPVQARYRMDSPAGARPATRIAEFAWQMKNFVRPLGYHRVGLPCQLMGSGMAIPWPLLENATLASAELVEDMLLGLELAGQGSAPLFCPHAVVWSTFPLTVQGAQAQRARWEHGHLGLITRILPHLMAQAVRQRSWTLMALAIDLLVPPLALLSILVAASGVAATVCAVLGFWGPLVAAGALHAALGASVGLAWWRYGRAILPGKELLLAVGYAAGKVPLYVRFLCRRQVAWIRTERR